MDNRVFKIRHATEKKKINAKYPECDDDDETLKKGNEERKFKIRFLVLLNFLSSHSLPSSFYSHFFESLTYIYGG